MLGGVGSSSTCSPGKLSCLGAPPLPPPPQPLPPSPACLPLAPVQPPTPVPQIQTPKPTDSRPRLVQPLCALSQAYWPPRVLPTSAGPPSRALGLLHLCLTLYCPEQHIFCHQPASPRAAHDPLRVLLLQMWKLRLGVPQLVKTLLGWETHRRRVPAGQGELQGGRRPGAPPSWPPSLPPPASRLPTAWCPGQKETLAKAQAGPAHLPIPLLQIRNKWGQGHLASFLRRCFRSGAERGGRGGRRGRGCTWAGLLPGPGRSLGDGAPRHPPAAAPTYAAQLPVEVAPAGPLTAPVQPARPFQHDLLQGEGASRPPRAGRSHEPGRPGVAHRGEGRTARSLCSPAHAVRLPAAGAPPRPEEPAPGGAPRPARAGKPRPYLEGEDPAGPGGLAAEGGCPTEQRGMGTRGMPRFPRRGAPGDA